MALEVRKPFASKLKIGDFFYVPFRQLDDKLPTLDTSMMKKTFEEEHFLHYKLTYLLNQQLVPSNLRVECASFINSSYCTMGDCPTWRIYSAMVKKMKELTEKLENILKNIAETNAYMEIEKKIDQERPLNLSSGSSEEELVVDSPTIFEFEVDEEEMTI